MLRTGYFLLSEWGKTQIEDKIKFLMHRDRYNSIHALLEQNTVPRSTYYKVIEREVAVRAATIAGVLKGLGLKAEDSRFYEFAASTALTTTDIPSAVEVMDAEYITNGDPFGKIWTQAELDESRRMSDRHEELLAKGYSEEQIDVLWAGKTPQEIIAGTGGNGTAPPLNSTATEGRFHVPYERKGVDNGFKKSPQLFTNAHQQEVLPLDTSSIALLSSFPQGVKLIDNSTYFSAKSIDSIGNNFPYLERQLHAERF